MARRHGKTPPRPLRDRSVRELVTRDYSHFLRDFEFRLRQAKEVSARKLHDRKVYTEDMALNQWMITGYTVTANSPTATNIAWATVRLVYNGTLYTITDGNTSAGGPFRYIWFDAVASTTVLQMSNTKPNLSGNATLVFINEGGTPISLLDGPGSVAPVVRDNAIDTGALQSQAVTAAKIANQTITTTQISGSANITGTQIAAGANLTGGQFANTTIGTTQLGNGAAVPADFGIFRHLIY